MYSIRYHKKTKQDKAKLQAAGLAANACSLIAVIKQNPYTNPPPYEKLVGNLGGLYSRRINITHRLVYSVDDSKKEVKILSMWSHYGD
ncbi:Toxin RelK [Thiorhodovibrio winogradskyi]|uniref:Putative mRNA interferase YoeB n=1 Tax=Thiorhodovibrio winogradskyi TaxID=77007 RepID=A0ABZ0SEE0_9GAMM|nr:Txe/YoeB family addiction module toxin [Thiorhodovibrio winogradskyi]